MIPIFWICAPALYFHKGRRSPPYIFRLFILRCTILLATARVLRARTRSQSTIHTVPLFLVASPKGDYTNTNTHTNTKYKYNDKYRDKDTQITFHTVLLHFRSIQRQIQTHIQRHGQIQGQNRELKTTNSDPKVRRRLCLVPPSPCPSPTFDTAVGNEQHHGK